MKQVPKSPKAQETKNLIFTAASQIVLKEGVEKLNTNYIAERAGVSIGTLYKYYEDKDAIIADILEQVIDARVNRVKEALSVSMIFEDREIVVDKVLAALLSDGAEDEIRLEQALLPFVPSQGHHREARAKRIEALVKPLLKGLILLRAPNMKDRDFDTFSFILLTSIKQVIVAASLPENSHYSREQLRRELKKMILGFISQ